MWTVLVRVPQQEPVEYNLKPGQNRVGRNLENEIPILDLSASRLHAAINFDAGSNKVSLLDLGSTNGTYVNRERVTAVRRLQHNDTIRIGGSTLELTELETGEIPKDATGTHRYTRELVLESLDQQAVLLYEVARKLNTVLDIDSALREVSTLMKQAMGADRCELILAEDFGRLPELQFPTTIAEAAIRQRSAVVVRDLGSDQLGKRSGSSMLLRIQSVLCVPVMTGEEVLGLVYMYKTAGNARSFTQKDLQLAVAISHQAALTIQRMHLIEKVQKEQQARELFQRFLSPAEADTMIHDYLKDGYLPGLMEQEVTILFADIANSTTLAERVGARKFGEILNRYYWDLTGAVFANSGLVKYLGDGIMAVFGMTGKTKQREDVERDMMRGVQSAIAILNHIEVTDFGEKIQIGVGVNTGKAMIGYVGTQERVEVTAVGDVSNVAFRLQAMARPNRLLVGPETAIGVAGKVPLKNLGMVELRGRTEPLQVYEVLRNVPGKDQGIGSA
jgi:adenylate cyclase